MSCPYFYPLQPWARLGSAPSAMLPLGDLWTGQCRAAPLHPCLPEEASLRPLCNLGYARGNCAHFPASSDGPDAVRFTISGHQESVLRLYYVMERNHHPFAHGPLEYSTADCCFLLLPEGDTFARQARAYVESYLRRKIAAA